MLSSHGARLSSGAVGLSVNFAAHGIAFHAEVTRG